MNDDEADEVLLLMSQLWWHSKSVPEGTLKLWLLMKEHLLMLQIGKTVPLHPLQTHSTFRNFAHFNIC